MRVDLENKIIDIVAMLTIAFISLLFSGTFIYEIIYG